MPISFDEFFRLGAGAHVTWIASEPLPQILIEWQLDDTNEDLSAVTFSVERSEDHAFTEFDTLVDGQPFLNPHEYLDTTAPLGDFTKKLYYRIRASRVGDSDVVSQATSWHGNPDFTAQEIIGRQTEYLEGYVGTPFVYWKQRTFGPRCDECWDIISKRSRTHDCSRCFGTGFAHPYHDPQPVWFSKETNEEMLRAAGLRQIPEGQLVVWYMRYPQYTAGDILAEAQTGKRYRIEQRKIVAEKRGVIIQQVLVMAELDRSMVQYRIPVDQAVVRALADQLRAERQLREF